MRIVNERIQHIVFGEGTIISHVDDRLSIQFSERYGIKQFFYPDAFEKYLRMNNPDLEFSVLKDLHDKQLRIEAERLRIEQEEEEANRIMMLERSQLAAQKKKSTPKSKVPKQKK